ncbi:DUF3509 domain-containing protein [Pseudomonas sp. OTU5201]|uniref:DUF3509 domain-containing protein n=1 Tax=Pseudomonas sp. OTU5201 TaxID=3043850 RepID=UPI00313DDA51
MQFTSPLFSGAFPGYEVSLASRPDGRVLMVLARHGECRSSKVIDAEALSNLATASKVIRQIQRDLRLQEGSLRWHSPDGHLISLELPTYQGGPLWQPYIRRWKGLGSSRRF